MIDLLLLEFGKYRVKRKRSLKTGNKNEANDADAKPILKTGTRRIKNKETSLAGSTNAARYRKRN